MPVERVLQAVREYLEEEAGIIDCASNEVSRAELRRDLGRAQHELRLALAEYEAANVRERAFRRVLVAVDRSEQATWAVDVAGRLARNLGTKVALVHVVAEPVAVGPEFLYTEPAFRAIRREEGEELLRHAQRRLPAGLDVEVQIYEGDPPHQIVAAAKDWRADLIVLGTHGRGAIVRLLLGSTAEWVVRHAPCPVMTVSHSSAGLFAEQVVSEAIEAAEPAGAK